MDVKTTGFKFGREQESHTALKVLLHRLLANYEKKKKEKYLQWRNVVGTS